MAHQWRRQYPSGHYDKYLKWLKWIPGQRPGTALTKNAILGNGINRSTAVANRHLQVKVF
jgi:hypothetical protein